MTTETIAKPKRWLYCSCCGAVAGAWEQWGNMDTGYGVCATCVDMIRKRNESRHDKIDIGRCYGIEGVNWGEYTTQS